LLEVNSADEKVEKIEKKKPRGVAYRLRLLLDLMAVDSCRMEFLEGRKKFSCSLPIKGKNSCIASSEKIMHVLCSQKKK